MKKSVYIEYVSRAALSPLSVSSLMLGVPYSFKRLLLSRFFLLKSIAFIFHLTPLLSLPALPTHLTCKEIIQQ